MNEQENLSVSVVIPSYRSESTLPRVLSSLRYQGSIVKEIVVVEDGVFDRTDEVLKRFPDVYHLCLDVNSGAAYARNQGLEYVTGEYVMFVDADDYLMPGLVEGLISAISKSRKDVAIGPCLSYWPSTGRRSMYEPNAADEVREFNVAARWLRGDSGPGTCSILWRKSALQKIGGWDANLRRNQDGDLAIRASLSGLTFSVSKTSYSVYVRSDSDSVSNNVSDLAFDSLFMIGKKVSQMIDEKKIPVSFRIYLSCYWARSALLAYRNKNYVYAEKFKEMAASIGFFLMKESIICKFLILFLGPRLGSLTWQRLRKIKRRIFQFSYMPRIVRR